MVGIVQSGYRPRRCRVDHIAEFCLAVPQQDIVGVFTVVRKLDRPAFGFAYASRQFFRERLARSIAIHCDDDFLGLLQLVVRLPDVAEFPVLRWIDGPVTHLDGSAIRDADCVSHPSLSGAEAINLPLHYD